MNRKILKILISLLFLVVAAVAAILSIKSFFPELLEQVKYGVKRIVGEPARKTPAFKKDKQEQDRRATDLEFAYKMGRKYGVDPVDMPPINYGRSEYGVAPVEMPPYREDMTDKYGVAPVQRPPRDMSLKYGVSPVQREKLLKKAKEIREQNVSKYGVAPVNGSTWQYEDKNIKN